MMRRGMTLLVCIYFTLLTCSVVVLAADDNWDYWFWECRAFAGNSASGMSFYGVSPGASDAYEEDSLIHDVASPVHVGVYHENDATWTGPTGFYEQDVKSPVPLVAGASKSWLISVWADPNLDTSVSAISFVARTDGALPPRDLAYTLTLLKRPTGIEGGPPEGTSYDMSYYGFQWGAVFELPAYRTEDGRNGYLLELKAAAVPEPSSLLALAGGLGCLATLHRRRRS